MSSFELMYYVNLAVHILRSFNWEDINTPYVNFTIRDFLETFPTYDSLMQERDRLEGLHEETFSDLRVALAEAKAFEEVKARGEDLPSDSSFNTNNLEREKRGLPALTRNEFLTQGPDNFPVAGPSTPRIGESPDTNTSIITIEGESKPISEVISGFNNAMSRFISYFPGLGYGHDLPDIHHLDNQSDNGQELSLHSPTTQRSERSPNQDSGYATDSVVGHSPTNATSENVNTNDSNLQRDNDSESEQRYTAEQKGKGKEK